MKTLETLFCNRRWLAFVLSILMADFGNLMGQPPPPPAYDGETILRGIFFGTGPVAQLFPEIWKAPEVRGYLEGYKIASPEVAKVQNKIVEGLRAEDPAFFDRFAADLKSGNRLRIDKSLRDAAGRVLKQVQKEYGLAASPRMMDVDVDVEIWLYLVAVVAVAAVAVAVVVVFIVLARGPNGSSTLRRDVWVNLIATRLRAH